MASKSKPITPAQVTQLKQESIPDEVFEAFNEMIVQKWNGSSANIKQPDLVKLIRAKLKANGKENEDIFGNHWLDVEDHYRKAGWKVEYDKPAYNETYEANFTFSKKGSR